MFKVFLAIRHRIWRVIWEASPKLLAFFFLTAALTLCAYTAVFITDKQALMVYAALALALFNAGITIALWILVAAKLLSTHEFRLIDLKSTHAEQLQKQVFDPMVKPSRPKKTVAKEPEIDEDFLEVEAEETAKRATELLFGGPKEKLNDSII